MADLVGRAVNQLISDFPEGKTPAALRMSPVGRDERYEFIGNILVKSLTSAGYRAYTALPLNPSDSTSAAPPAGVAAEREGLRLEYQVIDFTLRYPEIYRSYVIGGKKVKRSAGVRVQARLIDPADGLVVWTGEAADAYEDVFPYGAIDGVEAGLYQFTKPPRDSRKWGRIVEPVVVSGIIVGLIYLFFSNQGD
jgi:hypothetical protein